MGVKQMSTIGAKVKKKIVDKITRPYKTRLEQSETKGIQVLIKSDIVDIRREAMKNALPSIYEKLRNPETQREGIDDFKQLLLTNAIPWLRSRDDKVGLRKVNAFLELDADVGHLPSFYKVLAMCIMSLVAFSFHTKDVETPIPLYLKQPGFIVTPGQKVIPSGYGPDLKQREKEEVR